MQIMKKSSTATRSRPTLMPERRGMPRVARGLPLRAEKAVREFETVLMRMRTSDAVGTEDSENRREENDDHVAEPFVLQPHEIIDHARGNEEPEDGQEFALVNR